MKKTMVLSTALLTAMTLASTTLGAVSAATTIAPANSTADASFKAGGTTTPTKPVDPSDPDKPVDPSKPTDPTDDKNTGTGNVGPLTIDYVSNVHFGEQEIKDSAYFSTNTNPYVQISDKRGSGEGWDLSAKISDFKSDKDVVLKGAKLTLKNGQVKTATTNTATAPTAPTSIDLGAADTTVMSAAKTAGQGTWVDVFGGKEDIALSVPSGNITAGIVYTADLTWTLSATPK